MLKTKIRLPSGREISSGAEEETAIFYTRLTQCVNDSQELTLGSVCAAMLELDILDPGGSLVLEQGDEIRAFQTDGNGVTHSLGIFCLEKPERVSANMLRITAYDRVSRLDKDLTQWLAGLEGWPYSLLSFAQMVCQACGLTLTNTSLPNGDYQVQAFSGQGITGRKLLQWAGQIAGRFCRATADGRLEFAWYTPKNIALTPGGDRAYFQNGLSYEDYQVTPVEKVLLQLTEDDVGVVWPDTDQETNTYRITGNFLLTATDSDTLLPVAQNLYAMLSDVSYTPCRLQLPAEAGIRAGDAVTVTDRNGRTIQTFVMTRTLAGQLETLESTGSPRRDSSTAVNNEDYRALNNRMLELRKQADGLQVKVIEQRQDLSAVTESVADMQLKADELSVQISRVETDSSQALQSVNDSVQSLQQEVSAKMSPEAVEIQIQTAMENGAEKVVTRTGFTFDEEGLTVEKSGSEMKTQITENGMVVCQNGQEVLTANNQGVDAKNLHATTYLIVGANSRFEDYGWGRTGCFWIGGE